MLNPSPCPILEVLEPGNPIPVKTATNSDIRYDLGKYLIFHKGKSEIVENIENYWTKTKVTFLINLSEVFSLPIALMENLVYANLFLKYFSSIAESSFQYKEALLS